MVWFARRPSHSRSRPVTAGHSGGRSPPKSNRSDPSGAAAFGHGVAGAGDGGTACAAWAACAGVIAPASINDADDEAMVWFAREAGRGALGARAPRGGEADAGRGGRAATPFHVWEVHRWARGKAGAGGRAAADHRGVGAGARGAAAFGHGVLGG